MRTILAAATGLLLSAVCFAQAMNNNENALLFSIGTGYRITPVDLKIDQTSRFSIPVFYSRDMQISGMALNAGIQYYLAKSQLGFELGNSFRYDILYFENESLGIYDKSVFTMDYHFNVYKYFPLRKNAYKAAVGYSALNNGSNYAYKPAGGSIVHHDFNFLTFNINFGYQAGPMSFELVNRFTTSHKYDTRNQLYIPELRLSYSMRLKNKQLIQ